MKMFKVLAITSVIALGVTAARADLLVAWDFAGISGVTVGSITSTVAHADMAATSDMEISRGSGLTPSSNTGGYAANNWSQAGLDLDDYFQFNVKSGVGFVFDVDSVVYNIRRTGTGPANFELRSSLDGYASALDSFTASANGLYTNTLSSISGQSDVTFRLYGSGATGVAGSMNLGGTANDLIINGSVSVVPEPTTLAGLSLGFLAVYGFRRRKVRS